MFAVRLTEEFHPSADPNENENVRLKGASACI